MTALAGGPAELTEPQLTHVVAARPARAADAPAPAPGLQLLGRQQGSGYVVPPALVRRADGQVLQLTPLLYAVLESIDGRRDAEAVADVVSRSLGRTLLADDIRTLIDGKLRPMGLVVRADGSPPPLPRANPLLALRPRVVVSNPRLTRRITAPFAMLFNPLLVAVVTVAFAAVAYWVLFDKGLASAAYEAFARPGLLLSVFVITVATAGFHEFGHAAALRRGGGTPGAMGAGLYLVWPAFFTDVTDSYRLGRGARIRVDLGGLYFNAIAALATFAVWVGVRWDGLLLVIAAQILQMVRQLPPLVRFDGYHLLADVTGVPDLFHRIGPTLRSFLPRRWRRADSRVLKPWVRAVVTLWVLAVVPLLLASAAVTVVALPRIVGTTLHSVAMQATALSARAHTGDAAGAAVKALGIVALVVPVGGILLMLVRAVRSYGIRTWRATAGKPVQRGVAGVVAGAMLVGLGFAWWPHGGNYRPITPGERGTVQDALPSRVSATFATGHQSTARTVWVDDGMPLPPRDHPVLALVLRPKNKTGPTWVFPFDRPGAPGAGDNQALAVVTRDGGSVYDVAFALVWADQTTVLNRNEAYAFASCRACRAVAVGFQVVFVVGSAHVVAPQNLAAAVSYKCPGCVTEAVAQQLVLTLARPLPVDRRHQLEALWSRILWFGHHLRRLSAAQVQQRLLGYERQILAIVQPDLATPTGTSAASPAPSPSDSSSSAAPDPSPSDSSSATPTTAASPSTSQSTSPSPSPSGTSSSSTSSTPSASQSP